MSQYRRQFEKLSTGCKKPLLGLSGLALVLATTACNGQPDIPGPPQSPPKPVTSTLLAAPLAMGHISNAHFVMPGRVVLPRRGWM